MTPAMHVLSSPGSYLNGHTFFFFLAWHPCIGPIRLLFNFGTPPGGGGKMAHMPGTAGIFFWLFWYSRWGKTRKVPALGGTSPPGGGVPKSLGAWAPPRPPPQGGLKKKHGPNYGKFWLRRNQTLAKCCLVVYGEICPFLEIGNGKSVAAPSPLVIVWYQTHIVHRTLDEGYNHSRRVILRWLVWFSL